MNNEKVCFIMCSNNKQYEMECKRYLTELRIPKGMEVEILVERNAKGMAAGYNKAMKRTDAKYKVFLHQDLFIIEPEALGRAITTFQKYPEVGMFGVVGGVNLPKSGILYSSWNCGELFTCNGEVAFSITGKVKTQKDLLQVEAIDGCIMMTQYDIPWRDDLFKDWDFYDVSQCMEYRKAGYQIAILKQDSAWCFHDDGPRVLENYNKNRKIFLEEYGEMLHVADLEQQLDFNQDLWNTTQELKRQLKQLLNSSDYLQAFLFLRENYNKLSKDKELTIINNICGIVFEEKAMQSEIHFVERPDVMQWIEKYNRYKFWMYQLEHNNGTKEMQIQKAIEENQISVPALIQFVAHHSIKQVEVLEKLEKIYQAEGNGTVADIIRRMIEGIRGK